jgi:SAM-dependent methyltransferase
MAKCGGYDSSPITAEVYDHVVPYRERKDIDFFVDAAREANGPVLEIGCGTGRVLIPTARAGFEIVGMDFSKDMIAVCRRSLAEEPDEVQQRVTLVRGDMRDFDLGRQFALVTIPFRPFQHLETVPDQIDCLNAIHRHLVPGGKLILDLFNPSIKFLAVDNVGEEMGDEPEFEMPDGRKVLRRFRIIRRDFFEQIQDVEIIYYIAHPDGRKEESVHAFPMKYIFRWEAEHLLVRCGFEVEALYAGYDKSAFGSKDPGELVFVAVKK